MWEIVAETLLDNLKIFPFLFATYLFLEYLEHKTSDKTTALIRRADKAGPVIGSILGVLPQCGFSVVAANFYAVRLISLGTLIAVFLSTSDELLPILISYDISLKIILLIIGCKIVCGIAIGYLIDAFYHKKRMPRIETLCNTEHCHCEEYEGIWKPALYHSVKITLFILAVSLLLNIGLHYFDLSGQLAAVLRHPLLGEAAGAILGLIPNCSASVILPQMYIKDYISFSAMLSGSLVNAGVGLLVLFRVNRPMKQNLKITALLFFCGLLGGLCSNLIAP
ncbi:MAG: putative manganese transporter [Pseudomonadota bacterium]|nr:putative manganese transporter [Pseudomonadota bacterium]